MKYILWLPRAAYKLYLLLIFVISLVILYPLFYWLTAKESRFANAFKLMKFWALFLQLAGLIRIKKVGLANFPKDKPFILCANHSSYLDIILVYRLPLMYFVMMGKGEIRNWPLFRRFFVTGMNILVDRDKKVASHKALERAKQQLDKGKTVVIFPEGGIPDNCAPKMRGFKNGAFKIAIEKQVPIVPVTFQTNWKLLDSTRTFSGKASPGVSKIIIHKPINTTGMTLDDISLLRMKTRESIAQPLKQYLQ